VQCAVAIRDALGQLGINVRVGVHTGEIERRGDDVAGIAVHLAQRVQSKAQPGEVVVSRTVVDLVVGSDLRFRDRGKPIPLRSNRSNREKEDSRSLYACQRGCSAAASIEKLVPFVTSMRLSGPTPST
jgi:hypothetical protein